MPPLAPLHSAALPAPPRPALDYLDAPLIDPGGVTFCNSTALRHPAKTPRLCATAGRRLPEPALQGGAARRGSELRGWVYRPLLVCPLSALPSSYLLSSLLSPLSLLISSLFPLLSPLSFSLRDDCTARFSSVRPLFLSPACHLCPLLLLLLLLLFSSCPLQG